MSPAATVRVRVKANRALTLHVGEDSSTDSVLHVAGDELELDTADAKALADQGFVEPTK